MVFTVQYYYGKSARGKKGLWNADLQQALWKAPVKPFLLPPGELGGATPTWPSLLSGRLALSIPTSPLVYWSTTSTRVVSSLFHSSF